MCSFLLKSQLVQSLFAKLPTAIYEILLGSERVQKKKDISLWLISFFILLLLIFIYL